MVGEADHCSELNNIERSVADYYSMKLKEHGASHLGVDWNSQESQHLRFRQLVKVIDFSKPFTINDLGCGYGALYDYLRRITDQKFEYYGSDLSEDMVQVAASRHEGMFGCNFTSGNVIRCADYTIASGIYNVRLQISDSDWFGYIQSSLDNLNEYSERGFAFNMLTSYSDIDKRRDYLYYADPCSFFDLCKRRFAKEVALLHDYGLYEFSMIVRKSI